MNEDFDQHLRKLYFDQKMMYGRDKLYRHIQEHRPDLVAQGLSRRYIMNWLRKQEVHQLFMPAPTMREIQSTVAKAPFQIVGMDLLDMNSAETKDGYKWLLTAIDLFSKRGYAVPLKSKTAEDAVRGLALMMFGGRRELVISNNGRNIAMRAVKKNDSRYAIKAQMARLPRVLRSDNGPEFKNELMTAFLERASVLGSQDDASEAKPVKQVFGLPYKPQSNGQVERFNSIVKRQLKMIQTQGTGKKQANKDWVRLLPTVLANYNSSWSRITKSTPNAVEQAFIETGDADEAYENIKRAVVPKNQQLSQLAAKRFQVGDLVRVKLDWDKAAGLAWSRELYAVASVRTSSYGPRYRHTQYRLIDGEADMLPGVFYNDQLQRIDDLEQLVEGPAKFIVDRLVKPVVRDGVPMFEVKWQGYREHTYEPRADLLRDVPHLVHRFEAQRKVEWPSKADLRRNVQPDYDA